MSKHAALQFSPDRLLERFDRALIAIGKLIKEQFPEKWATDDHIYPGGNFLQWLWVLWTCSVDIQMEFQRKSRKSPMKRRDVQSLYRLPTGKALLLLRRFSLPGTIYLLLWEDDINLSPRMLKMTNAVKTQENKLAYWTSNHISLMRNWLKTSTVQMFA